MDFEKLVKQRIDDQSSAGMKDMAGMVSAFHAGLIEQDMNDFDALELAKEFIGQMFQHARETEMNRKAMGS